jgi:hypothetical protein
MNWLIDWLGFCRGESCFADLWPVADPAPLQPYARRGVPDASIEIVIPHQDTAVAAPITGDAAEEMAWQILEWRAADRRRAKRKRCLR